MAEAGIVGDYKGSQAREVTMKLEEYEELAREVSALDRQEFTAVDEDEAEPQDEYEYEYEEEEEEEEENEDEQEEQEV
jgi:hypothetical protein